MDELHYRLSFRGTNKFKITETILGRDRKKLTVRSVVRGPHVSCPSVFENSRCKRALFAQLNQRYSYLLSRNNNSFCTK